MNGILDAREVTFEEARDDLAAEASADRARRLVADRSDGIEDLLASGATLEEVADETGMELGEVAFTTDTDEGIAAYPAFREAAAAATAEDFPALASLDDGGVFALRLDRIDPPALRPLDEVREAAVEGWTEAETRDRLLALAEALKARIEGGDALESTGVVATRYEGFAREGFIADTPAQVVEEVFALAPGGAAVVDAGGRVFVAALADIIPADMAGDDVARTRAALSDQVGQALSEDMLQLYTQAIQTEAGVTLDGAALNAVHAQMN
jgi:peptidyl-prolyl cis-trans isomerase D